MRAILFSYRGRLSRGLYWRVTGQLNLALALTLSAGICLVSATLQRLDGTTAFDMARTAAFLIAACLAIAFVWITTAMLAKRCHDCGMTSWWMLLFLLPYGGIVFFCLIGARRGMARANRFGPGSAALMPLRDN